LIIRAEFLDDNKYHCIITHDGKALIKELALIVDVEFSGSFAACSGGVPFNLVHSATITKYELQPPGIGHHVLRNFLTFLGNVKFTLERATKAQTESRGIALLFL